MTQKASGGGRIELASLSKSYGDQLVLDGINLAVEPGEFFSLLGPSGCGKTTTLRLIGGFEAVDEGSIRIDGAEMAGIAPEKRPVNTVFQSYALFPHKNVFDNVMFGLRFQGCTKREARDRVGEALRLVRLSELSGRKPHQLSGGQQQRVALARSLVLRPKVLLLDEPLGALDAKLRRLLQMELRSLHTEVGITFVYVTHDQEEALTMSDRLAVMNAGRIEQVGTPREVYDEPANKYVADFLGLANLLPGHCGERGVDMLGVHVAADARGVSGACTVLVRPERLALVPPLEGQLRAQVDHVVFAGAATHLHLRVGGHSLQAVVPNDGASLAAVEGGEVGLMLRPDALRVLSD